MIVEHPSLSEASRWLEAIDGRTEASLPEPLRGRRGEDPGELGRFALGPGGILGAGLDVPGGHRQFLHRERSIRDPNVELALDRIAGFGEGAGPEGRGAGAPVEIDSEKRLVHERVRVVPEVERFSRGEALGGSERRLAPELDDEDASLLRLRVRHPENHRIAAGHAGSRSQQRRRENARNSHRSCHHTSWSR